jgi:small subunit ribosomal protein S20
MEWPGPDRGRDGLADAILAVFAETPGERLGQAIGFTGQRHMATASKAKKKTVRIASGLKRARQDLKLNAANTALRSRFRTVIKNVQKAVDAGDKAKAAELFKTAQPIIDSVADKNLFHKNKAARHKSRLAAKVKALATAA